MRSVLAAALASGLWACLQGSAAARQMTAASRNPVAPSAHAAADDVENDPCAEPRLDLSEARCRKLLRATENAYGPSSLKTANILFVLARKIDGQARFSEAEPLYRRAVAISLKIVAASTWTPEQRFKVAEDANLFSFGDGLIENLEKQRRPLEAEVVAAMLRQHDSPDGRARISTGPYSSATFLPGIANVHWPPAIRPPTQAEKTQVAAWWNQAQADDHEGRLSHAESLYRDILHIDEQTLGPAHPETSSVRRMLRFNLSLQHRWAQAEQVSGKAGSGAALRAVLILFEQAKSNEAPAQSSDAESFYRIALYVSTHPLDYTDTVQIDEYSRVAANLDRQGHIFAAEQFYREIAKAYEMRGGPLSPDVLEYKHLIASSLARQGQFARAVVAFRDACGGRAERSFEAGRGELASLSGSTNIQSQASNCALEEALSMQAWGSQGGGPAPGDLETALRAQAFEAAQASLQSSAGDALARAVADTAARSGGAGDGPETYEMKLAERDAVEKEISQAAGRALPAALVKRRSDLALEIAKIADSLARQNPLYWDLRSPRPLSVASLQARSGPDAALLHANEALVLWMIAPGGNKGLVFAVSKNRVGWARMALTGDDLGSRVKFLRSRIDPQGSRRVVPRFDRKIAYELFDALLGDPAIQRVIEGPGVDTLLIVPSGPLTSLPPSLLVVKAPIGEDDDPAALRATPWLIRAKAIAVLPAVSSLRTLREVLPQARSRSGVKADLPLLAFADPDFHGDHAIPRPPPDPAVVDSSAAVARAAIIGRRLQDLPPLYGTLAEGEALAKLLGARDQDLLLGPAASKTELFARQRDGTLFRSRVIAFSTHGLVSGDLGLTEPALALAHPPENADPGDDGLLTASQAARLRLDADWVVLSACNTASPGAPGAEGLSGLARAFFYAGARSLLVSHWRVRDDAAQRIVTETFRLRKADPKLSKAKALRRSMLTLMDDPAEDDNPGQTFANPQAWAPFIVVGEAE
ncbi:MAG TPA: CHAT domain-containing tetratricopeptide repeat protein [Caulobacteraceae bacterium]